MHSLLTLNEPLLHAGQALENEAHTSCATAWFGMLKVQMGTKRLRRMPPKVRHRLTPHCAGEPACMT